MLNAPFVMLLELVSEVSGRNYPMQPDVLGKVLSLARQEGWQADHVLEQSVSDTRDTAIVLPHFGAYMPSRVSRADAKGLRIALTKALATGAVAAHGTDEAGANTLLQVTREGAFRIRLRRPESCSEEQAYADEVSV